MDIFRMFLSEHLGPSVARKFFSWTKHDKNNKLWTFLNPTSTNNYRFRCNFTEKTGKIGILVFEKKCWKIHRKDAFVPKTAFRISLKLYIATYNYLYSLDWEKSKVFFIMFCPGKKFLATIGSKTLDKKSNKWPFLRLILVY
jgi:hypothetical protein